MWRSDWIMTKANAVWLASTTREGSATNGRMAGRRQTEALRFLSTLRFLRTFSYTLENLSTHPPSRGIGPKMLEGGGSGLSRTCRDPLFLTLPPADRIRAEGQTMATVERRGAIIVDPEVQAAVDRVLRGVRDPDAMLQAAERMDRMREEMRQRVGNVDLAVPLIRETRNEE
jgi:hypothetical protein